MRVFVINLRDKPLMPCSNKKARKLLRDKKAKIVYYNPFTIQLLYTTGETIYQTPRGHKYKLKIDTEYNGLDLYSVNSYDREDYITGYEDLKDFLNQQELSIDIPCLSF